MKLKKTGLKRSHTSSATRRKRMMMNNHKKVLWRQRASFITAHAE